VQRREVLALGGLQQRDDRLDPGGLDRLEIEARGERVAEQPVEVVGGRVLGSLEQLAQHDLVAAAHLLERAPGPVAGGNRVGVEPAAVGEAVEVDPGIRGRVPIRRAQSHALIMPARS
jgi:hypothetical protein